MKLVSLNCPNCGGNIQLDADKKFGFCMHCGTKVMLDDEIKKVKITNLPTVENLLILAERAHSLEKAYKLYSKALKLDPNNLEILYSRIKVTEDNYKFGHDLKIYFNESQKRNISRDKIIGKLIELKKGVSMGLKRNLKVYIIYSFIQELNLSSEILFKKMESAVTFNQIFKNANIVLKIAKENNNIKVQLEKTKKYLERIINIISEDIELLDEPEGNFDENLKKIIFLFKKYEDKIEGTSDMKVSEEVIEKLIKNILEYKLTHKDTVQIKLKELQNFFPDSQLLSQTIREDIKLKLKRRSVSIAIVFFMIYLFIAERALFMMIILVIGMIFGILGKIEEWQEESSDEEED